MGRRYSDIAFTPSVRALQEAQGSRDLYARYTRLMSLSSARSRRARFSSPHAMASTSHRSRRPAGHMCIRRSAGLRDGPRRRRSGLRRLPRNRQSTATGNVAVDDRVSLFLMDYPARRRLKLFGRMRAVERSADPEQVSRLAPLGYRAVIERAFLDQGRGVRLELPATSRLVSPARRSPRSRRFRPDLCRGAGANGWAWITRGRRDPSFSFGSKTK